MDTQHGKGYSQRLAQPCCLYSRVLTCPCAGFFCPVPANKHSFLVSEESHQWPKEQWIWFIPLTSCFQKKYVLSRYQLGFLVILLEAMDKSGRKTDREDKEESGLYIGKDRVAGRKELNGFDGERGREEETRAWTTQTWKNKMRSCM